MLDYTKILIDGGVLAVLFSAAVLAIGVFKPRAFLDASNVPADILAAVPARTAEEARQGKLLAAPLFVLMLAIPAYSAVTFAQQAGAGYWVLLAHTYLVLLVPFLADLLIIDWLILNTITPKFFVYPGTEGFAGYKDYGFHLRAHLRGLVLLVLLAAPVAAAALALA
jgi:hypothetical protein